MLDGFYVSARTVLCIRGWIGRGSRGWDIRLEQKHEHLDRALSRYTSINAKGSPTDLVAYPVYRIELVNLHPPKPNTSGNAAQAFPLTFPCAASIFSTQT